MTMVPVAWALPVLRVSHHVSDVHPEGRIAIVVEIEFLAIHVHGGLVVRTLEIEFVTAVLSFWTFQNLPVPCLSADHESLLIVTIRVKRADMTAFGRCGIGLHTPVMRQVQRTFLCPVTVHGLTETLFSIPVLPVLVNTYLSLRCTIEDTHAHNQHRQ